MSLRLLGLGLFSLVAGCVAPGSDDIVGPFTGARHRFVVDSFELPVNNSMAHEMGDDLTGDNTVDNRFGMVMGMLAQEDNLQRHTSELRASGVLASIVEIQADDLLSDERVGVWYHGHVDAPATPVGGRFLDGHFVPNRTASSTATGKAIVSLPVFADADPSVLELVGMEMFLAPDGRGGYDAELHGGFRQPKANEVARAGILQLLDARPQDHRTFWLLVDRDQDGEVTLDEIAHGLLGSLLAPDIHLRVDGETVELLSVGFRAHLSPCPTGDCAPAIGDRCFDRIADGNETGVDCGGSCRPCEGGQGCTLGPDCQSGVCGGGLCTAPTCSDGILDGFERNIDCGGACTGCAAGAPCTFQSDCASGVCGMNRTCT